MVQAFTGDSFLAREAVLAECALLNVPAKFVPPEVGIVSQEVSGGLFGPGGALVDLREIGEGEWKPLREFMEKLSSDDVVLLYDPRPTGPRIKWYKDKAHRRDSPMPEKRDITNWVMNRAKAYDLKLNAQIASFLGSLVAGKGSAENPAAGLEALDQELKKLTLISSNLTLEKVKSVVALQIPVSGFDLVRSTTEGKTQIAFAQMQDILDSGEDPIRVIGALSYQYIRIAKTWMLIQDRGNISEADVATMLGMHPFAAKQTLALTRPLKRRQVEKAIDVLLEAEQSSKTGGEPRLALEGAVVKLAKLR